MSVVPTPEHNILDEVLSSICKVEEPHQRPEKEYIFLKIHAFVLFAFLCYSI